MRSLSKHRSRAIPGTASRAPTRLCATLAIVIAASTTSCTAAVLPQPSSELRLFCYLCDRPDLPTPLDLTVTVRQETSRRAINPEDFERPHDFPTSQLTIPTASTGSVEIEVRFGPTVASTILDLQPDWRWDVLTMVGGRRPLDPPTMGEFGRVAVPLPMRSDSLLLSWGGNSISSPVVY